MSFRPRNPCAPEGADVAPPSPGQATAGDELARGRNRFYGILDGSHLPSSALGPTKCEKEIYDILKDLLTHSFNVYSAPTCAVPGHAMTTKTRTSRTDDGAWGSTDSWDNGRQCSRASTWTGQRKLPEEAGLGANRRVRVSIEGEGQKAPDTAL